MSTDYMNFDAIIPSMFTTDPVIQPLVDLLNKHGLARNEKNGDIHFKVNSYGFGSRIDGYEIRNLPENISSDDDNPTELTLLPHLIKTGKIFLVYESGWSSFGWDFEE